MEIFTWNPKVICPDCKKVVALSFLSRKMKCWDCTLMDDFNSEKIAVEGEK